MYNRQRVDFLVVDSSAFIKNLSVEKMGVRICTIPHVAAEIRNKAARARLAVLPYQLEILEPHDASIKKVIQFAKSTGDYLVLSQIDIQLIALTLQLEELHCNPRHVRTENARKRPLGAFQLLIGEETSLDAPKTGRKVTTENDNRLLVRVSRKDPLYMAPGLQALIKEDNQPLKVCSTDPRISPTIDGLKLLSGLQLSGSPEDNRPDCEPSATDGGLVVTPREAQPTPGTEPLGGVPTPEHHPGDQVLLEDRSDTGYLAVTSSSVGDSIGSGGEGSDLSEESDSDSDVGWVTPSNISKVKAHLGTTDELLPEDCPDIKVACMTTDFAMQNVLMQLGLHVVSVEGLVIREVRSYVLQCYGCFRVTTRMDKVFCPHCGNRTLARMPATLDAEGQLEVVWSHQPRKFSTRGTKQGAAKKPPSPGISRIQQVPRLLSSTVGESRFPVPLPTGGKHQRHDIVLTEDQLSHYRNRLPKQRDKVDAFGQEFFVRSSPFAAHDVSSRAFALGLHVTHASRRNPNEVQGRKQKRK